MVLYNSRVKLYDFNVLDSRVTLEAEYYIETVNEALVVKRRLIESHRFFFKDEFTETVVGEEVVSELNVEDEFMSYLNEKVGGIIDLDASDVKSELITQYPWLQDKIGEPESEPEPELESEPEPESEPDAGEGEGVDDVHKIKNWRF